MAKSFANNGHPLQPQVNQLAERMVHDATDGVLQGMPKRRNALRARFSAVLDAFRDNVVDAVNQSFRRNDVDDERVVSSVGSIVEASTSAEDNTTYSREVKAAHRTFREQVIALFAEQAPVPDTAPAQAAPFTWNDHEAREAFMPEVLSSIVNDALDSLHTQLLDAKPPVISGQEEITGTDRYLLSQFLLQLKDWMERTAVRHFRGQNISLDQFKRRLSTELDGVDTRVTSLATSAALQARPNKLHPDMLVLIRHCIQGIVERISPLDDVSIFTGPARPEIQTWDPDVRFLPKTNAFLEERLVADTHLPHVIEGAPLHSLERFRRQRRGAVKTSDVRYALDMLNDDFHGDITRLEDGKTVRVVMEPDVLAALEAIDRRETDEKMTEYLPGMLRRAADLHADVAIASLSMAVETGLLESAPDRKAVLASGETVALPGMTHWFDEWQSLARSVAHDTLIAKTAHIAGLSTEQKLPTAKSVLVEEANGVQSEIIGDLRKRLAAAQNPPSSNAIALLTPQSVSHAAFQSITDAPEQSGSYQFKVLSRAEVPLFRGRTNLENFPVTEKESSALQVMLRGYVGGQRFQGRTLEESVDLIAEPGELLEVMSAQCNRQFHGGLSFRSPADLKASARIYLGGLGFNFRAPEREEPVIKEELGWLIERDLWPTERDLQRAMRRIAMDAYGSTEPIEASKDPVAPLRRRELLLERFAETPHTRSLAKWVRLPDTADECDPRLREKLFTEALEVETWVRQLVNERKALTPHELSALQNRARQTAYAGGQNIWHIHDFEEFALREYRRVSEQQCPTEVLGSHAHSSVQEPSNYPHRSPHWLVERQLIIDATAGLRIVSRWPTERETQQILLRVVRAISPDRMPDGETLKSLREAIMDFFNQALAVQSLAESRPQDLAPTGIPDEVQTITLARADRERALVQRHIPELAKTAVAGLLTEEPDSFLARAAACRLLEEPKVHGVTDLESEIRFHIYGNRSVWKAEDLREYLTRSVADEIMILWPDARAEALSNSPVPVQATDQPDESTVEPPVNVAFRDPVELEPEHGSTFESDASHTVAQTIVPPQGGPCDVHIVVPVAATYEPSLPAPSFDPIPDAEVVPESAVKLQNLLRDAYLRAHNGVPSIDVLLELEREMDSAEATIGEALTFIPSQTAYLYERHTDAFDACTRKDDPNSAPPQQDIQLLRDFKVKLEAYTKAVSEAETSRVAWPGFRNALRAHFNAVNGFLAFQKDFARIAGVDVEELAQLLELDAHTNGVDESLAKISELTDRHEALSERIEHHTDDEFLTAEARDALARTVDMRLEDITRLLTNLLQIASGAVVPPSPSQSPSQAAPGESDDVPTTSLVPVEDQLLVHSLLLFASGGVEAGNRNMGVSAFRFRKSCEALGLQEASRLSVQNPDDPAFQSLLPFCVCTLEAQQAIDAWWRGLRKGQEGFPGGKASFPNALLKADKLFVLTLNTAGYWAFTATEKGKRYAEEHGTRLSLAQVDGLATARKAGNF